MFFLGEEDEDWEEVDLVLLEDWVRKIEGREDVVIEDVESMAGYHDEEAEGESTVRL